MTSADERGGAEVVARSTHRLENGRCEGRASALTRYSSALWPSVMGAWNVRRLAGRDGGAIATYGGDGS
jgi:hypothetical protein